LSAKPVVVLIRLGLAALCLTGFGSVPSLAKAPLPMVLLYPASPEDVPALVDIRTRLRIDGHLQVLTYDPDSASVKRAVAEASHPEWLMGLLSDDTRLALARALGVAFYAVVSPGHTSDSTHVQLVNTAPPALTFDWYGVNHEYGARALESQAEAALASATSDKSPVSTPAPVVAMPIPAPVVAMPIPAPVVAMPIPAPVVVAPKPLPAIVTPVLQPFVEKTPALKPAPIAPPVSKPVFSAPTVSLKLPPTIPIPPAVSVEPKPGTRVAALPPSEHTLTPAPPEIEPAHLTKPVPDTITAVKANAQAEDLSLIAPLLKKADTALDGGDVVGAISLYRKAVNGAPLSVVPRLKLAKAYQKGGLSDKALNEAKRALEIAPDSLPVQQLLTDLDQENGTSDGTLTRYRTLTERNPDDPTAHAGLAEALWNSGDLSGAENEYKTAKKLAPADDHSADAHLAQLYATQARYSDCLAALRNAGKDGYALALKIVKNRADTLSATIEASRDAFAGGKSTREQFYDGAKQTSAQAQALADFVAKVVPPNGCKLSHLHRKLATNLLAQEAATLVVFIETGDTQQGDRVSQLEKSAQTEILTAQAAEEKLGLWDGKK
jgi:tetratricopeptide (TPR) repeat protein